MSTHGLGPGWECDEVRFVMYAPVPPASGMWNAQGKVAVKSFPQALGYTVKALMLLAIGSAARTALSEPYPLTGVEWVTGVEMGCNEFESWQAGTNF